MTHIEMPDSYTARTTHGAPKARLADELCNNGRLFHCPVCGSSVRKLYPNGYDLPVLWELDVIGGERRENDTCPVCWSHCRMRLLHRYLMREAGLIGRAGRRAREVAPATGIALFLMRMSNVDLVLADLHPERYGYLNEVARLDLTAIPFEANAFDVILCNHVLEHVPDDARAMRELLRVLKPGGCRRGGAALWPARPRSHLRCRLPGAPGARGL